jgi:hypothetical protein
MIRSVLFPLRSLTLFTLERCPSLWKGSCYSCLLLTEEEACGLSCPISYAPPLCSPAQHVLCASLNPSSPSTSRNHFAERSSFVWQLSSWTRDGPTKLALCTRALSSCGSQECVRLALADGIGYMHSPCSGDWGLCKCGIWRCLMKECKQHGLCQSSICCPHNRFHVCV